MNITEQHSAIDAYIQKEYSDNQIVILLRGTEPLDTRKAIVVATFKNIFGRRILATFKLDYSENQVKVFAHALEA